MISKINDLINFMINNVDNHTYTIVDTASMIGYIYKPIAYRYWFENEIKITLILPDEMTIKITRLGTLGPSVRIKIYKENVRISEIDFDKIYDLLSKFIGASMEQIIVFNGLITERELSIVHKKHFRKKDVGSKHFPRVIKINDFLFFYNNTMVDKDINELLYYIMESMYIPHLSYTVVPSVGMLGCIELEEFGDYGHEVIINLLLPNNMQILISIDGDQFPRVKIEINHILNGVVMEVGEVYDYLLKYVDASAEQVVVPSYELSNDKMLELYKEVFAN